MKKFEREKESLGERCVKTLGRVRGRGGFGRRERHETVLGVARGQGGGGGDVGSGALPGEGEGGGHLGVLGRAGGVLDEVVLKVLHIGVQQVEQVHAQLGDGVVVVADRVIPCHVLVKGHSLVHPLPGAFVICFTERLSGQSLLNPFPQQFNLGLLIEKEKEKKRKRR